MDKVLVLGGGFAGVEAAIWSRKAGAEVTLVSDRDYAFIYPISIWIPTGAMPFEKATLSLVELARAHGFELVVSRVEGIDIEHRTVQLADRELPYEQLVLAFGSSKTKLPGTEHTLSICGTPKKSLLIRERLDELMKAAEEDSAGRRFRLAFGFAGDARDKSTVRGGPIFELLFNIDHLLKKRGLRQHFDLVFFAPMPKPGAKMGDKALEFMDKWFEKLEVEQRVGTKIKRFEEDGIVFADDSRVDADMILFIPPNAGHPLAEAAGLPLTEAGFVQTDEYCRVVGHPGVWAAGDVAHIEGPAWIAKQGHLAEVMGRVTAHNIGRLARGAQSDALERYTDHLSILCVMDTGSGAAFVYRDDHRQMMIPLPVIGHWLKQGWGSYWRLSKLGKMPRLPGM